MSNYDKAMQHWKNHRKDRFVQQCSGPVHNVVESPKVSSIIYSIRTNEDKLVFEDTDYTKVIQYGKSLFNPECYWLVSTTTFYGRLDSVLKIEGGIKNK